MAKTQQRILTGEEQQHQGCMTIKIITANKAFLAAGVVQGTEGARTRHVPPCPRSGRSWPCSSPNAK